MRITKQIQLTAFVPGFVSGFLIARGWACRISSVRRKRGTASEKRWRAQRAWSRWLDAFIQNWSKLVILNGEPREAIWNRWFQHFFFKGHHNFQKDPNGWCLKGLITFGYLWRIYGWIKGQKLHLNNLTAAMCNRDTSACWKHSCAARGKTPFDLSHHGEFLVPWILIRAGKPADVVETVTWLPCVLVKFDCDSFAAGNALILWLSI